MTSNPLISIVTISFNQAEFLERTIKSVLEQDYPNVEYIVVDPGSTDGSRAIIDRYIDRIASTVFEPDNGAADGLNKGFAKATGDIYGFLNSDDILLPGALSEAVAYLVQHPKTDVVSGHSTIIDADDKLIRKGYSGRFSLRRYAYRGAGLMQPSTFFRKEIFEKVGGFYVQNKISWDGELFVDMALRGAKFSRANCLWSGFRLHSQSLTSSKRLDEEFRMNARRMFVKIIGREPNKKDGLIEFAYRLRRHLFGPRALYQRVVYGPIYGGGRR